MTEAQLDLMAQQTLYLVQEAYDLGSSNLSVANDGAYSANGRRISAVADPDSEDDVVTVRYLQGQVTDGYNAHSERLLAEQAAVQTQTDAAQVSLAASQVAQAQSATLTAETQAEAHALTASNAATLAQTAEATATASALLAQKASDAIPWEVKRVSASQNPVQATAGDYLKVDLSQGSVTIILPLLAEAGEPSGVWIDAQVAENSTASVTVTTTQSDTINQTLSTVTLYGGNNAKFLGDLDSSPDDWVMVQSGVLYTSQVETTLILGTDYTAGATTLNLPTEWQNVIVTGLYQNGTRLPNTAWAQTGQTLTVTEALTSSTATVSVVAVRPNIMGRPSENSITGTELQAASVAPEHLTEAVQNLFMPVTPTGLCFQHRETSARSTTTVARYKYGQRPLTDIVFNTIPSVDLVENQFTLPVGTYYIEGWGMASGATLHRAYLWDVTNNEAFLTGTTMEAVDVGTKSHFKSLVTLTGPRTFEMQHYVQTSNYPAYLGLYGEDDMLSPFVFADLQIFKVA